MLDIHNGVPISNRPRGLGLFRRACTISRYLRALYREMDSPSKHSGSGWSIIAGWNTAKPQGILFPTFEGDNIATFNHCNPERDAPIGNREIATAFWISDRNILRGGLDEARGWRQQTPMFSETSTTQLFW